MSWLVYNNYYTMHVEQIIIQVRVVEIAPLKWHASRYVHS